MVQSIQHPTTTSITDHTKTITAAFEKLSANNVKYNASNNCIDYKDLPPGVCDQSLFHNQHTTFICDIDLKKINNKLTMNIAKVMNSE